MRRETERRECLGREGVSFDDFDLEDFIPSILSRETGEHAHLRV